MLYHDFGRLLSFSFIVIPLAKATFLVFQPLSVDVLIPANWVSALTSHRIRHLHLHFLTLHLHIQRSPLPIHRTFDQMLMHPNRRNIILLYFFLNEYGLAAVATDQVIVEVGSIDDHYLACALLRIVAIAWLLEVYTTGVHLD